MNRRDFAKIMLGAAVAGIVSGSATVAEAKGKRKHKAAAHHTADAHECKGKNECKGKGGCKTGDGGCKGKNSCKGKGGCATNKEEKKEASKPVAAGQVAKTLADAEKGKHECKGKN